LKHLGPEPLTAGVTQPPRLHPSPSHESGAVTAGVTLPGRPGPTDGATPGPGGPVRSGCCRAAAPGPGRAGRRQAGPPAGSRVPASTSQSRCTPWPRYTTVTAGHGPSHRTVPSLPVIPGFNFPEFLRLQLSQVPPASCQCRRSLSGRTGNFPVTRSRRLARIRAPGPPGPWRAGHTFYDQLELEQSP
jgi:hypothetical protein